jgi:hypothetical protein
LHTEVFTGEPLNQLIFSTPASDGDSYAETIGYKFFTENLAEDFHIGEPPLSGRLKVGTPYNGRLINQDLARYQMYVGWLATTGLLDVDDGRKRLFLEIGPGYGALPFHVSRLRPNGFTSIIVDLPIMLLVSAAYIATNRPNARIHIYDPVDPTPIDREKAEQYDFIFMPNYRMDLLSEITGIDIAFNSLSIQEMETKEANSYINFISERLKGLFFLHFNDFAKPPLLVERLRDRFRVYPDRDCYSDYLGPSKTPTTALFYAATHDPVLISRLAASELSPDYAPRWL